MTGWRLLRRLPLWSVALFTYVFLLSPILAVALASLERDKAYHFQFPPAHFSLTWYWHIPANYLQALGISFTVATVAALCSTFLGAMAALGLVRGRILGAAFIDAFFRLPLQIPFVVTDVVFLQFYYPLLDATGINLLGNLGGLIVAHIFITIPYSVGAVSVVLMRAGPRLEEAAASLGATHWSTFRRVTFPLMKPGLFAGLFYAFIVSFGDVPVAVFLANGDFVTLPVEIFQSLQFDFDPAILSISTLVVLFSLLLILAVQRLAGLDLVLPASRR